MNHIRYIERSIAFAPYVHEQIVTFPLESRINLENLWFQIRGKAAARPNVPLELYPYNVHAYISGVDVTASVISELKKKIDALKVEDVQEQYRAGMESWLRLVRAYGMAYPGNVANDAALAQKLAATPRPSTLLVTLGDKAVGSGGGLHVFNYLYSHIDIEPVSMWDLIQAHNSTGGPPLDVKLLPAPKLVLSAGPSASYDPAFDPDIHKPFGGVELRLILSYHDPLEDRVQELERLLDRLQRQILARLDSIADACVDGGPFQLSIASLKGNVAALQQEVSSMKASLASNTAQTAALQAQAKALQDAVNQL